jgi:alkanesulfonate monooxygenase SsuD/methylene tetrahydromethanopterin reductase-like flavin-dependent oxidoreductase (luciferase family)
VGNVIEGTPESIAQQLRDYAAAGVDEALVDWWELDEPEGLQVLADDVMPALV